MNSPALFDWQAERDAMMASVERNAGSKFTAQARAHVLFMLRQRGEVRGEDIVSSGEILGIVAHDARAWGPVFGALSRQRLIEKAGHCQRTKGHGTGGGIIWRLAR